MDNVTVNSSASSMLAETDKMTLAAYCDYFTVTFATILLVAQLHYIYQTTSQQKISFEIEFSIILLLLIAVFDIMQIFGHFASGVRMIIYSQDARVGLEGDWTGFFGALITSGWNGASIALCFITMHRFCWLWAPKFARVFLSPSVAKTFLSLLCLLFLLNVLFVLVIREAGISFYPETMRWNISPSSPQSLPKSILLILNTITNSGVVYFNLPFLIGISLIMIKRKMLSFYLYATFTWFLWEFVTSMPLSYFWKYIVNVLTWMIWNGMKPFSVYLQDGVRHLHHQNHRPGVHSTTHLQPAQRKGKSETTVVQKTRRDFHSVRSV